MVINVFDVLFILPSTFLASYFVSSIQLLMPCCLSWISNLLPSFFFFFNLDKDVPQDGLLLGSLRMPECDACHFFCGLLGWFGFSTCFVETLEICTNSRLSFFFSYLFFGGCVKQLFFTWEWLPNIPCPTAIILQFLVQSLSPHRLPAAENYFPYLQHFITYVAVLFHSLVNWCHFKFLRIHPWA